MLGKFSVKPFSKGLRSRGARSPSSRSAEREISPERAEQARSGIMRSETQEGEPEISPVDCFGPGEPSSGVPPARRRRVPRIRKRARGNGYRKYHLVWPSPLGSAAAARSQYDKR